MPVIECVPNISEGRRRAVVDAIVNAMSATPGARILDVSPDPAHHRTVITMVGEAAAMQRAVLTLFEHAVSAIDLREHSGAHPRLGAVDVVPFVPISDVSMSDCVALARETASQVASQYRLPVFLYEEAATRADRRNLADIRRGEFEGLAAKLADPVWMPDFGPMQPHPSAGASVIGARMPLIAFNVNLATNRLDIAKEIAATLRERNGGLPAVKALGLALTDRRMVQVSMNLTNYQKTSIATAFLAVQAEANRRGVRVLESEIVGLIPAAALAGITPGAVLLTGFDDNQILERRIAERDSIRATNSSQ